MAGQFGALVARLHRHARGWTIPPRFVRPAYDVAFVRQALTLLAPGVELGIITPREYATIQETYGAIGEVVAALAATPWDWGLIHNDLHAGNCLVRDGEVCPIDFSLCGFGPFLYDLGTAVAGLQPPLRRPFLEGYRRCGQLPESPPRPLEALALFSRLNSYAFALPNPATTGCDDGCRRSWRANAGGCCATNASCSRCSSRHRRYATAAGSGRAPTLL